MSQCFTFPSSHLIQNKTFYCDLEIPTNGRFVRSFVCISFKKWRVRIFFGFDKKWKLFFLSFFWKCNFLASRKNSSFLLFIALLKKVISPHCGWIKGSEVSRKGIAVHDGNRGSRFDSHLLNELPIIVEKWSIKLIRKTHINKIYKIDPSWVNFTQLTTKNNRIVLSQ